MRLYGWLVMVVKYEIEWLVGYGCRKVKYEIEWLLGYVGRR